MLTPVVDVEHQKWKAPQEQGKTVEKASGSESEGSLVLNFYIEEETSSLKGEEAWGKLAKKLKLGGENSRPCELYKDVFLLECRQEPGDLHQHVNECHKLRVFWIQRLGDRAGGVFQSSDSACKLRRLLDILQEVDHAVVNPVCDIDQLLPCNATCDEQEQG